MSLRKNVVNVDVDTALEKNPVGYFHYLLILLCGINFMSDALEVNLLSFLSTCAGEEWNLSDTAQASITSVVFAGIIAGSMFWGSFADRVGRRVAFIAAGTVISIGGILTCFATSFPYLVAFRGLVGLGIGGSNIAFDLLAEYLPPKNRGSLLIFIEYFWTFGSMLVAGVAWLCLSKYGWRLLAGVTVIPIAFTVIFSIFYLPESPRWHLMQGNHEEAKKVIEWAYRQNGVSLTDMFGENVRIVDENHVDSVHSSAVNEANATSPLPQNDLLMDDDSFEPVQQHIESELSYWNIILDKNIRKVSIPLWCVWALFGFTYYGLILFVARVYSKNSSSGDDNEQSCSFDYSSIFINSLSELIGTTFGVVLIDRIGRVNTQMIFYLLSGLFVAMVSVPSLSSGGVLAVAFVGRMCIMTASSSTWVLTPELYSTEYRTFGHAICVSMSKVGAFISPFIVVSSFSIPAVATILGIANALAVLSVYFLPDSTGLSLGKGRQNSIALILPGSTDAGSDYVNDVLHNPLILNQEESPKKFRDNFL
jgi:putative MFS transporter